MTEEIFCRLCGHAQPVSAEDPDTSVSEMVQHAATAHGYDQRLAMAGVIDLRDVPNQQIAKDGIERR